MAFEDTLKSISLNADASIAGFTGVSGVAAGGGPSTFVKIASIAFSTPNVTVTTAAAHGYSVGDVVYIANATTAGNNGGFTVASIGSATTFTFANTSGAAQAGAAGTVNKTNFNQLYRFVKITGAKTAGLCTANDDYSIGVLQNKPQYTGQAAQVGFLGVSYVITGASVSLTAGDKVMSDTLGAAVKAAPTVLNADVATSSGFAVSSGVVTLTLGTSTAFKAGDQITISGATSAKNNGTFTVASITSGTVLTYNNAVAVAENGAASAATRATAIRQPVIAGTTLASSSTPGELIPVLLAAR
jgi:hypothetical protein